MVRTISERGQNKVRTMSEQSQNKVVAGGGWDEICISFGVEKVHGLQIPVRYPMAWQATNLTTGQCLQYRVFHPVGDEQFLYNFAHR
jgi:hypothetical protein